MISLSGAIDSGEYEDITIVANRKDMLEILKNLDLEEFDGMHINTEGEYFFISFADFFDEEMLFIECIYRDGELVAEDTDLLVLLQGVPDRIKNNIKDTSDYKLVVEF